MSKDLPKRPQDMTEAERSRHWAKVHVAADRRPPFQIPGKHRPFATGCQL